MLYFNFSPNSHLSVVSITFVLHLFMPQLWVCYRLLTRADDFQGLIGFSLFHQQTAQSSLPSGKPTWAQLLGEQDWDQVISQCLSSDLPYLAAGWRFSHAFSRWVMIASVDAALIWTIWVVMALECCVTELKMKQRQKKEKVSVFSDSLQWKGVWSPAGTILGLFFCTESELWWNAFVKAVWFI